MTLEEIEKDEEEEEVAEEVVSENLSLTEDLPKASTSRVLEEEAEKTARKENSTREEALARGGEGQVGREETSGGRGKSSEG